MLLSSAAVTRPSWSSEDKALYPLVSLLPPRHASEAPQRFVMPLALLSRLKTEHGDLRINTAV